MQSPDYIISSCTTSFSAVTRFDLDAPTTNEVYSLFFLGSTPAGCYTIIGTSTGPTDTVVAQYLFTDCDECVNGVPVNTFYESDIPGLPGCCESGTTANPPKAEYATLGGVAIQMNTVELGGFNGLNN